MPQTVSAFHNSDIVYNHFLNKNNTTREYSTHSHTMMCEILFFRQGNASYVIENREYKLQENDLVFIRPARYHYIRFDAPHSYERYVIKFNNNALHINTDILPGDGEIFHCEQGGIIESIFKKLDYYTAKFDKKALSEIVAFLIKEIVYNLSLSNSPAPAPKLLSPAVSEALNYINEHLFTIKNVEEISRAVYVSENYFFNTFKKQMHITPKKYLTEKRLLYAQDRIRLANGYLRGVRFSKLPLLLPRLYAIF